MNTQAQLNIYKAIKSANTNGPIKRSELMALTGLSDRMVRADIEKLRDEGIRICATSHDAGYWEAQGEEDYKAFRRYYLSPTYKLFRRVAAMDANTIGQIGM